MKNSAALRGGALSDKGGTLSDKSDRSDESDRSETAMEVAMEICNGDLRAKY
ncbi:hypothetical protein [Porphyromonas somerae]|uniref:hypothetical protein n=1 Tax=Porphyromonas somerae TaxID=322095 RepID=UPI002A75A45B|nr:hypothetical protein [Porphyromonas somerae]